MGRGEVKESVMRRRNPLRHVFTLIELLVVIAIITILIAILLPVIIRVKQHAQQLRCAANLQQIGYAMTIYTGQDGFFPMAAITSDGGTAECWPVRLRNILKSNQGVFYCQAQDSRCQWKADDPGSVASDKEYDTCFGYEFGERLFII